MTKCECGCTQKGSEFFCTRCFHNFNKADSFHEFEGMTLCPKCHPKDEIIWKCFDRETPPRYIELLLKNDIEQFVGAWMGTNSHDYHIVPSNIKDKGKIATHWRRKER